MQHRSQNVNISQLVDFSTNAYIKNMRNRNVLAFSTSNSHQFWIIGCVGNMWIVVHNPDI